MFFIGEGNKLMVAATNIKRKINLEQYVISCPNCETKYQVTSQDLENCRNVVRCTKCLTMWTVTQLSTIEAPSFSEPTRSPTYSKFTEDHENVMKVNFDQPTERPSFPHTSQPSGAHTDNEPFTHSADTQSSGEYRTNRASFTNPQQTPSYSQELQNFLHNDMDTLRESLNRHQRGKATKAKRSVEILAVMIAIGLMSLVLFSERHTIAQFFGTVKDKVIAATTPPTEE